jgi:hypothetical protein
MSRPSDDLVGFIVGEHPDGTFIYGCDDHIRAPAFREPHRQVFRYEADLSEATCGVCGLELAKARAIDE